MLEVRLTSFELFHGACIGVCRRVEGITKPGKHDQRGPDQYDGWQRDVESALAEMALAKHLGEYWTKGFAGDSDVGGREVRHTASHYNRLMLYKDDNPDSRYYLVTGKYGVYRLQGWILGRDGMKEEYWEDPTGKDWWAYFVPTRLLNQEL